MSLEERIQKLEDIEAIKKMKAMYTYAVDQEDWDYVLDCYTDDAIFDLGEMFAGKYVGKNEIAKFFKEDLPALLPFMIHMVHNPVIEVTGNTAKGRWYYEEPVIWGDTEEDRKKGRAKQSGWICGAYEDDYVKIDGKWKFKSTVIKFFYQTGYTTGWAKENFITQTAKEGRKLNDFPWW